MPSLPLPRMVNPALSAAMAEQLKLSLSGGVHHCPLQLHLSSDFITENIYLLDLSHEFTWYCCE